MSIVLSSNYQKVVQSDLLSFLQTELASGRTLIPGEAGFRVVKDRGFSVSRTPNSAPANRLFEVQTLQNTQFIPTSVAVYFSQTPDEVAAAVAAQSLAGRQLTNTHFEADKFGVPSLDLVFYEYGALGSVDYFSVDVVAAGIEATTEQDTEIDLPENSIVLNVFLDVITPESTGGTKTIDVGIDGVSGNLFFDGADCSAATQLVASAGWSGPVYSYPTVYGGRVTFTLGSDDWVEFVGRLHFELRSFG